jgi:MFS superfamily sulfate permease-like transporter
MNDAAGGRTQVAGLVAAAAIALILLFLTGPLQYLPVAALGAVLIMAAVSLVDIAALKEIYRISRREFALSVITMLGVVALGAIHAILLAVVLALLRFVHMVSRPAVEQLGEVPGLPGLHSTARHESAIRRPGLVLFRFNAPVVFFNAPHFKREVLAAVDASGPGLKWLVIDMLPITMVDATGLYAVRELYATLQKRGITLVFAGRQAESQQWLERRNVAGAGSETKAFPTLRQALRAFVEEHGDAAKAPAGRPRV